MGRELTAKDTIISMMFRRNAAGEIVEVEPKRDEYVTPQRGRYRLQLSGISDTFEMTSTFNGVEKTVTKVRLEFMIVKGKNLDGRRFTELYTWSVSEKSNLGKLIGELRGRAIAPGETVNPDDFIGATFIASTSLNETGKYAGVLADSIEPDSIQLPVAAGAAPTDDGAGDELPPELAAVGAPDDPFEIEDL